MSMYVATLVANAPDSCLEEAALEAAFQEIHALHEAPSWQFPAPSREWLRAGEACDIFFSYQEENLRRLKHPWLRMGPVHAVRGMMLLIVAWMMYAKAQGIRIEMPAYAASIVPYVWIAVFAALIFWFPMYWPKKVLRTAAWWEVVKEDGYGVTPKRVREVLERAFAGLGVDVVIQPVATKDARVKKLLITDMDSTMITVECIDELADFVGKKAEVAAITERAMNGELDFAAALTERVALLRGLPEETLTQCYNERVKMMPGGRELVAMMKARGAHAVLVSGGFTFFTQRVAAELGFDEHYANVLEVADGRLTGRVVPPILGKEAKLEVLQRKVRELGITTDDVLAVGDGANDLPMLLAAGLGVAYHAKPSVQAQAHHRVNHCDLSALLWAQGIRM